MTRLLTYLQLETCSESYRPRFIKRLYPSDFSVDFDAHEGEYIDFSLWRVTESFVQVLSSSWALLATLASATGTGGGNGILRASRCLAGTHNCHDNAVCTYARGEFLVFLKLRNFQKKKSNISMLKN